MYIIWFIILSCAPFGIPHNHYGRQFKPVINVYIPTAGVLKVYFVQLNCTITFVSRRSTADMYLYLYIYMDMALRRQSFLRQWRPSYNKDTRCAHIIRWTILFRITRCRCMIGIYCALYGTGTL